VQPQVRLAEVEVPIPAPAPRVTNSAPIAGPTATAKGSLVGLPITTPLPQPSPRLAAAQPLPSRYGPAGSELPPGWVQGPSGRPVAAPQQMAALAYEAPAHGTPIAVPLPQARPGAALAYDPSRGTPISVALPKPRPGSSMRVAGFEGAADPTQAFAALTGETDEPAVALGYAAGGLESTPFATASIPAPSRLQPAAQTAGLAAETRAPNDVASRWIAPPPSPTAAAVARAAAQSSQTAKTDRVADPTARFVAGKSDRASEGRLWDVSGSAAGRGFAQLRHPDQESLTGLLAKPGVALATGFGFGALDDLAARRFSGPAIVALAVLRTD